MSFLSPVLRSVSVSSLKRVNVPEVPPSASAGEIRRVLRETGARIVAVVDSAGKLHGVVYRSSVLLATASRKSEANASSLLDDPPVILSPSQSGEEALRLMLRADEWYAPVVERGIYMGFIGLESFIELGIEKAARALESVYADEVMTRDVVTVSPEDPVSKVWKLMTERRYAGFPVVDKKGRLVGIITQYDLLRGGYTRVELEATSGPRVRDVMNSDVVYAFTWTSMIEVARSMIERGVGRIPVVESKSNRRLVGIIDREDVARLLLEGVGG